MQIIPISEALNAAGLDAPDLNALVPDASNYTVLLMQPSGDIEGSAEGVRNRERHITPPEF